MTRRGEDSVRSRARASAGDRPGRTALRQGGSARALLCLLVILAGAAAGQAQPTAALPVARVDADADSVRVTCNGQVLTAQLADARLLLATPAREVRLTPNLQAGDGWITPGRGAVIPSTPSAGTVAHVTLRYPVAGDREFVLDLDVFAAAPAFVVSSRLRQLRNTVASYYYWSSDVTLERYSTPGPQGPVEVAADGTKWETIPCHEWLFLPAPTGGVAVFPTNVTGHGPGPGSFFLHALPRSMLLAPGDDHLTCFGLAGVASPAAAATLAGQLGADLDAHREALTLPRPEPQAAALRPGPAWLRQADLYNLYYQPAAQWTDAVVTERLRRVPLVVGSTPDKAALERCHRAGIRLLHYVVYTCLLDTDVQTQGGGRIYSEWTESIDHQARDLKNHPDWVCIDAQGKAQKDAWGQAHGHPGLLNTCLHQPGLQEAALRQVRLLMELGFDGVFIDLAGPTVECYGAVLGKHSHPSPSASNTDAYEALLAKIGDVVRAAGNERIVMQNTCTGILPAHWPSCDLQMLEAFPYAEDSAELRAPWPELRWNGRRAAAIVAQGKTPVVLTYLSKMPVPRVFDAALFSYAYARAYGFLWADSFSLFERPETRAAAEALYAARLGLPSAPATALGQALYRPFEKGLVVLNPTRQTLAVKVPVPQAQRWDEVGCGRTLEAVAGQLSIDLAPESGRVLVPAAGEQAR